MHLRNTNLKGHVSDVEARLRRQKNGGQCQSTSSDGREAVATHEEKVVAVACEGSGSAGGVPLLFRSQRTDEIEVLLKSSEPCVSDIGALKSLRSKGQPLSLPEICVFAGVVNRRTSIKQKR